MRKLSNLVRFVMPRLGHPIVPGTFRANFLHLYLDIAWFAITAATAMSFVGVFITRQGASAFQLGLLSAGPGVVNLLISAAAGRWLERRPLEKSVRLTAILNRATYLPWVVLPFFLTPGAQVWSILGLTVLAGIPGSALSIGFNALFAEAVPMEWRGHVAGRRNALYAIIFILVTLLAGWILKTLPFPRGYQVIFALAVLGAAMSTVHLGLIRLRIAEPHAPELEAVGAVDAATADVVAATAVVTAEVADAPAAALTRRPGLRLDLLQGAFGKVLLALAILHLALFLPSPLFSLYMVNDLGLTDSQISFGTALFYVAMLAGSLSLDRLVRRFGNQKVTAIGALFISCYPLVMALGRNVWGFMASSPFGGLGWALAGGAMINWLLERVSPAERAASLVWYNLAINAAMLLGALLGSAGGDWMGVRTALLVFGGARVLAALYILKRG